MTFHLGRTRKMALSGVILLGCLGPYLWNRSSKTPDNPIQEVSTTRSQSEDRPLLAGPLSPTSRVQPTELAPVASLSESSLLLVCFHEEGQISQSRPKEPLQPYPRIWRGWATWGNEVSLDRTSGQRTWRVEVPPGTYIVHPGPGWGTKQRVRVDASNPCELSFTREPLARRIAVECLQPDSSAAADATIWAVNNDVVYLDWPATEIGPEGQRLAVGNRGQIIAMHERWGRSSIEQILEADPSQRTIKLQLTDQLPSQLVIFGESPCRLMLTPTLESAARQESEGSEESHEPLQFLASVKPGTHKISGLPPGEYKWFIEAQGVQVGQLDQGTVLLEAGSSTSIRPQLCATGSIEVAVEHPSIRPGQLEVIAYSQSWPWKGTLEEVETGRYRREGMPPGEYVIACRQEDLSGKATCQVSPSRRSSCRVFLSEQPSISGQVLADWDLPLDAEVWASRPGQNVNTYLARSSITPGRTFKLVGLKPGTVVNLRALSQSPQFVFGQSEGVTFPSSGNVISTIDPQVLGGHISIAAFTSGNAAPKQGIAHVVFGEALDSPFPITLDGESQTIGPIPPGRVGVRITGAGCIQAFIKDLQVIKGQVTEAPLVELHMGGRIGFDLSMVDDASEPRMVRLEHNSASDTVRWVRLDQGERWTSWIRPGLWLAKVSFGSAPSIPMEIYVEQGEENVVVVEPQ